MCLISKLRFPRKALRDIECFKVLYKNGDEYFTPYMDTVVNVNEPLKAKGWSISIIPYEKARGYIHTYSSLNVARASIMVLDDPSVVIFKCIIPKGTKYHISAYYTEYCSKQIKFISQIPSYEIHNIH
jgi:hypothetical protein